MNTDGEQAVRDVVGGASEHARSDESIVAELAALDPIEYDRRREATAGLLGVRVATLDAEVAKRRPKPPTPAGDGGATFTDAWGVEPWPSAVDGAELLDELRAAVARHVILPPHAPEAIALWILHTWSHDAADSSPILLLTSPEKRCGKTQALSVLARLVSKPLAAANISAAALFRAVEKWRPTLLIDEADTFAVENDELRGLLNSGHSRATARAVRTVGDDHEPRSFSTWAPKAIACIGKLRDTITDRSIEIRMKRKQRSEAVARLRGENLLMG
jgi:putative DNA primase/helicase